MDLTSRKNSRHSEKRDTLRRNCSEPQTPSKGANNRQKRIRRSKDL